MKNFKKLFKVLMTNDTIIDLNLSCKSGTFRNYYMNLDTLDHGLCLYLSQPNCLLNFLNIYGCNIGAKGLASLVKALNVNKSILYLNIGSNNLTGTHCA